jgi:glucan biosynthesis protein C
MNQQILNDANRDDFGGRQYFLDWVRILAFAFLIFYHTGMMFVSWGFHIESGHNSLFLKSIMLLTSNWRLDILFIVSGVAISFMITKMPLKTFTWQRVIKLYFPLLFAVVVVVAPQSYYEAIQKEVFEGSFWQFWTTQYFTFTWDERMNAPFPTFNHMWYVLYLFHYTIVLLPLFSFINSEKGKRLLSRIENWLSQGSRIVWFPLMLYILNLLVFDDDKITHAFIDDWYAHSIFLFAMIMGLLFVRMPLVWQAFEDNRYISLTLGLTSYGALLTIFLIPNESLPFDPDEVWGLIALVVKWSWMALVIGFARKYLNFTNKALNYCNGIVYPFFILHQTIIIVFGYYVIDWGLSGISEFLIIAVGTFVICGLLYEGVIKRINTLRIIFGLKWQKRSRQTQVSKLKEQLQ